MNIHDVTEVPPVAPEEFISEIFNKQSQLCDKYRAIEGFPEFPMDIDGAINQVWMKDFLWRITEEVAESMEAYYGKDPIHQIEELADSLHFMVEAMLAVGVEPIIPNLATIVAMHQNTQKDYISCCLTVFFKAGMIGNTLKNKRWKQSQILTDVLKFRRLLNETFVALIGAFVASGCSAEDIFTFYFKKSEVNQFRIRSQY